MTRFLLCVGGRGGCLFVRVCAMDGSHLFSQQSQTHTHPIYRAISLSSNRAIYQALRLISNYRRPGHPRLFFPRPDDDLTTRPLPLPCHTRSRSATSSRTATATRVQPAPSSTFSRQRCPRARSSAPTSPGEAASTCAARTSTHRTPRSASAFFEVTATREHRANFATRTQ